jgi:general secretion pathway protein D
MVSMKKLGILSFILFLFWAALVSAEAAQKRYRLPSGSVELVDLIRKVSKITGFSFLYGDEVSGKTNLIINHPVSAQESFEILVSVLAEKGFTTIEKGRVIKIVPTGKDVDPRLVFLKGEPIGPSDNRITVFIELSHISSVSAVDSLLPLMGKQGKLLASPVGNRLIVVDTAANVDRIRKTVAVMDQEGAKIKIELIPLKLANAETVADILMRLFKTVGRMRGNAFGKSFVALADPRTNSVVVQAPDHEITVARKLLSRIDDPKHPMSVSVDYLKHAGSEEIAEIFSTLE